MNLARVLIVEDESLVAEELALQLRALSYEVCGSVDNAQDAFACARDTRPDLALVDISIKGPQSGIDVARRFREEFELPVVFLTAYADAGTLKEAIATEPFGYLVKPFDRRALAATLETALRRRRAEQQLAKMERWLVATMSSIGDGVIASDSELRVTFINPVAERLCGWAPREALGRAVDEVLAIRQESGGTLRSLIDQVIREGTVIHLGECSVVTRDGRTLPIDDTIAPIRDESGVFSGVVIVLRDATERVRYEQQLRQLNTDLEGMVRRRTAQLEAANVELAAFSYSIAHDLRAPLRAILAFSSRLSDQHAANLDVEGHRLLNIVTSRASQMAQMINDYLHLSGLGQYELNYQRLDMTELAREAWRTVTAGVIRPPQLSLSLLPEAEGDESLIRQVWTNLLSNAVKFTRNVQDPQVTITAREDETFLHYQITDNGVGFDPAYSGKLFQVFARLHSASEYEGNGIGLCIVQRIVHRHEGDIRLDALEGRGATVTFWLPKSAPAPKEKG